MRFRCDRLRWLAKPVGGRTETYGFNPENICRTEASLSADEFTALEALRAAHEEYSELIRITQIPTAAEMDQLMGSYDWSKPIGLVFTSDTSGFLV